MYKQPSFEDNLLWHIQMAVKDALVEVLKELDLEKIIKEGIKEGIVVKKQ